MKNMNILFVLVILALAGLSVGCATTMSPNGTISASAPVLGTINFYAASRPAVQVVVSLNEDYTCDLFAGSQHVGEIDWSAPMEVWLNKNHGIQSPDGATLVAKCVGSNGSPATDLQRFRYPRHGVDHQAWEVRPRPLRAQ